MIEKLQALLAMFLFGLACGMMLRDWQSKRRATRLRQGELRAEWYRLHPPPPKSDRPNPAS